MKKGYNLHDAEKLNGDIKPYGYKVPFTTKSLRYIKHTYQDPVIIRNISIFFKALDEIITRLGKPDYIVIEAGRDIGKVRKQRANIRTKNLKHYHTNQKIRTYLKNHHYTYLGRGGHKNILKYKLFNRQHGKDLYTGKKFIMHKIFDSNNYVQVDHIQPISISENNSFNNLTLTFTSCNQNKSNHTPLQWLNGSRKTKFLKFVNSLFPKYKILRKKNGKPKRNKKGKIKKKIIQAHIAIRINFLRVVPIPGIKLWQRRDLSDNQNIVVFIYNLLRKHLIYRKSKYLNKQRTYISNGRVTGLLRHAWNLRKVRSLSDKHHAIDACLIAVSTPNLKNKVDKFYKRWGYTGIRPQFPYPYNNYLKEVRTVPTHVRRLYTVSPTPQANKDSKYSNKYLKHGLIMRYIPVTNLKYRTKLGRILISCNGFKVSPKTYSSNEEITKGLKSALSKNHDGKKAFPSGYLKTKHFKIYRVKGFKKYKGGVIAKDNSGIYPNGRIIKVLVYSKQHHYFLVPVRAVDLFKRQVPTTIASGKKHKNHINNSYHYCFKLFNFTPIKIQFKKQRTLKFGNKTYRTSTFNGYFRRIASNRLLVQPFDMTSMGDRKHYAGISMSSIKKIWKLKPNDFLGNNYSKI